MNLNDLRDKLKQADNSPQQWDPPLCGEIDLVIKYDGSWHYQGSVISRPEIVRLFASVLRRKEQLYLLVTPVEKLIIQVEDAPFVVTQWNQLQGLIYLTTSVGEEVCISEQHPIKLLPSPHTGEVLPYCEIRENLMARIHQNVFYQLAACGQIEQHQNASCLMLQSGDYKFSLGEV
ncbi:DUF1285 domain-containing protein [Neptunicella marina]|uniref:DUF1285 domain-containing protein n=1 Tax=Neptunicella marina TaxID=2125989 RepID=A0A8J6LZW8_9ALTE|nr:DUF1285 domain-containing protein [Neptunicella marina]MBC3766520.1 DUF1285 domain-containing protein [Neptunicella marina]